MSEQQYEDYGRELARLFVMADFVYIDELGKPDELIAGARERGLPMIIVWAAPDEDLEAVRDSYTSLLRGSIAVLHVTDNSLTERRDAQQLAREELLQLLDKMCFDEAEGTLADLQVRIDNSRVPLTRIGPFGSSWWGMAAEFTWRAPRDSLI